LGPAVDETETGGGAGTGGRGAVPAGTVTVEVAVMR